MKALVLALVIAGSIVSLSIGLFQWGRAVQLERHNSDLQIALESEQISSRLNAAGIADCDLKLAKASAKLDLVDAWLGLTARRAEVVKGLARGK